MQISSLGEDAHGKLHGHAVACVVHEEHRLLQEKLDAIKALCPSAVTRCSSDCSMQVRNDCFNSLSEHLGALLVFMVQHFAHEERMMLKLPPTLDVTVHVQAHRAAHTQISVAANQCASLFDRENPAASASALCDLISGWLRQHMLDYDAMLLTLFSEAGI